RPFPVLSVCSAQSTPRTPRPRMGGVRDAPRTATSGRSPRPPRLPATALEAPPPSRTGRPPPLRSRYRRTAGPSSRSASTRRLPPSSPVRACASFAHLAGPRQQGGQVDRSHRLPVLVQDHVVLLALPEHGGGFPPEPGVVQMGAEHPGTHPLLVRLMPGDGHAQLVGDPDQLITRPDPADVAQVVHLFRSTANSSPRLWTATVSSFRDRMSSSFRPSSDTCSRSAGTMRWARLRWSVHHRNSSITMSHSSSHGSGSIGPQFLNS